MKLDVPVYFLTWTCYGTWLHGDSKGSVDPTQNRIDQENRPADESLKAKRQSQMQDELYELDEPRREVVLRAIIQDCEFRKRCLIAVHVRSNHVHVIVRADGVSAAQVMTQLKAYSSRRLNEAGLDDRDRKRWTRHGSTRYLWTGEDVWSAVRYVVHRQGSPMSVFISEEYAVVGPDP